MYCERREPLPPKRGGGRSLALLESWGGATIVYRRSLTEAPSYTLNHEEVEKAMQEGIRFRRAHHVPESHRDV